MFVSDASKIGTLHGGFGLKRAFQLGGEGVAEFRCHDQQPPVAVICQAVVEAIVDRHRQVGGQGPGGGGPDRHL